MADVKIRAGAAVASVALTDEFEVDTGADTHQKATAAQIIAAAFVNTAPTLGWYSPAADTIRTPNSAIVDDILYVNDSSNAFMTKGLTIQQGNNVNEGFAIKCTSVTHGMTDVAEADTYATFQTVNGAGGFQFRGFGYATVGLYLAGFHTTDDATRSTAGLGAVVIRGGLKSAATVGSLAADQNLLVVQNVATTRFILDSDGDSHQDVGTAWTNFDHLDDVAALDALSYNVARADDPIKHKFGEWMLDKRPELERHKIVTFNADGHHFVNMSKLTMLNTGAIRQLHGEIKALASRFALLEHHNG